MKPYLRTLLVSAAVATAAPLTIYPTAYAGDKEEASLDQIPKATRDAIEREAQAQGGRVESVKRLSDDGRLFKAEIKKGDTKMMVYLDDDGKVVGRHTEKK
jgi:hypothetical protein